MAVIDPALAEAAAKAVRTAYPVNLPFTPSQTPAATPVPTVPVDPAKVAQLKAGAQAGSAGIDAFNSAKAQIDALQAQAVKDAQTRAGIIGGPEAQGFESIPNQFYDRAKAGLALSQGASQNLQAQNRAAFDKYFGQLKGDMGAINDYIKNTLGSYEAKKRSAAEKAAASKFPIDEILGQTELDQDKIQSGLAAAGQKIPALQAEVDRQKNRVFTAPLQQQFDTNKAQISALQKSLQNSKDTGSYNSAVARKVDEQIRELNRKNALLEGHIAKGRATEDRKLAEASTALAAAQKEYDTLKGQADPTTYARQLAVSKYGISPAMAAGKITPDKFVPKAATALDTQKYGADAVGLSQKLDIKGGPAKVREYLDDSEVQDDLATLTDWSQGGKYTLDDAKKELGKQYLTTKKPEDRDKYNILIEMTYRLPWKKGK